MIETVKAMDELRKAAKMALSDEMSGETLATYAMMAVKQFFSDYSTLVEAERVADIRGYLGQPVYNAVKYQRGGETGNINAFINLEPAEFMKWERLPRDPAIQALGSNGRCTYYKLSDIDSLVFPDENGEIIFKRQHQFRDIHKPGLFSRFFTKEEV